MTQKRLILIADNDITTVRPLKSALAGRYDVIAAKDGSKALELSVLRYPDLILVARNLPVINATQFVRIIKSNPRTEDVAMMIISDRPMSAQQVPGFLQAVLVKPLNTEEVAARIEDLFRRVDTAKQVGSEDGAVSGSLDQMPMVDLLQVFSINRRSGGLQITGPGKQSGEIFLNEGRIEDATAGVARGEKALYRMVSWKTGRFSFVPGRRGTAVTIEGGTDGLLMEGLRQSDEMGRLDEDLPGPNARLERLVPDEAMPDGLHPVTKEILKLVGLYSRLGDLMDRADAHDLEVALGLRSLLEAGLIRVASQSPGAELAVLDQNDVYELRSRLRRIGLPPMYLDGPKLAVVAADSDVLRRFASVLGRLPGYIPGELESLVRMPYGTLGRLRVDVGLYVEVIALPASEAMLPLSYALTAGVIGGLVFAAGKLSTMEGVLSMLEDERRASLTVARLSGEPEVLTSSKRDVLLLSELDEAGVRRLLNTALQNAGQADLRGVNL